MTTLASTPTSGAKTLRRWDNHTDQKDSAVPTTSSAFGIDSGAHRRAPPTYAAHNPNDPAAVIAALLLSQLRPNQGIDAPTTLGMTAKHRPGHPAAAGKRARYHIVKEFD